MAPDFDGNNETSLSQIVDGFAALSDEYKHLAEKHFALEANLAAATDELALLRKRFSDQLPAAAQKQSFNNTDGTVPIKPRYNLNEWLNRIRGETPAVQETLSRIREAELASYGVKNRLDGCQMSRAGSSLRLTSSFKGSASKPGRNRVRISKVNMADLEQDFTTTTGVAGQLDCPFAPKEDANEEVPNGSQQQHIQTRRSSGSNAASGAKRSRNPSLNDPMRPTLNGPAALSTVASEAVEGTESPACPIRFLEDHPPEEVAKYFEEHKHEIPRSHEFCVKRFQGDENSVKQLDAKYGNLVTMIQGLGKKHQPMFPETPERANSQPEEDRKSAIKVRSWANAVSEAAVGGTKDEPTKTGTQSEGTGEEERVSHFDRPLKEIRVGESPSRPWGVPIPSKYLDRVLSSRNTAGRDQSPPAPVKMDGPMAVAKPDVDLEEVPEKAKPVKEPRGKCPFDHTKLGVGMGPDATASKQDNAGAAVPSTSTKKEEAKAGVDRHDFYREYTPKAKVTESTTVHESTSESGQTPQIINTGTIFAADWKYLNARTLDNRGTLIVGYDPPRFAPAKQL